MTVTKFNYDMYLGEQGDLAAGGLYFDDGDMVIFDARAAFDDYGRPNMPLLDNLVEIIAENILHYDRRVFIFCDGGIDKAPFIAWCVVEAVGDWDAEEEAGAIYGLIKATRPQIVEHYEWVEQRIQWLKEQGIYV